MLRLHQPGPIACLTLELTPGLARVRALLQAKIRIKTYEATTYRQPAQAKGIRLPGPCQ
ncbi:hypothetical protein AERO9A_110041 [Aeromonas salmonicida]|nr:hypothetical protein AERO9A_110041 [Aeromonas salmonicida]